MIGWLLVKSLTSLKKEGLIVLGVPAFLLALPVLVVITTASSGVAAVSGALAAINPITHLVEIHDPNGNVVAQLQATTTWPVRGVVTTEFGAPDPPYQKHHTDIDIAKGTGEPITTFMEGTVLKVETNPNNATGYGEYVLVGHSNSITSVYGHMSKPEALVGQTVKPGDEIGLEGNTGHSTGPHVHFEVRVYDVPVDPRTFMVGNPTP